MAYASRDYSRNELSRSEVGHGYKTASSHFYTPSRQAGTSYGRGSSSGPGTTTNTQTSRFSLGGGNLRKQADSHDLRQSIGMKPPTQSASKYSKYDYTNRRNLDFGLGQLADSSKTPNYSKSHYRTTVHDPGSYSSMDKHSMSYAGRMYGTSSYGTYSRHPRESEKITSGLFTQTENGSIAKPLESSAISRSTIAGKDIVPVMKNTQSANFEESKLILNRFQRVHKKNRANRV